MLQTVDTASPQEPKIYVWFLENRTDREYF